LKKVTSIILIFCILIFGIVFTGAFFIKPITFKLNNSGGWSVALVNLDSTESIFDVYSKIENNQLTWINKNTVETKDSVVFLADPFLISHNDSTYLYLETQIKGRGAYITCFYIPDNASAPVYLGVALKESFHLSYPQVIKFGDKYLMIPESQSGDSSFVYVSTKMPLDWKRNGYIYTEKIKDPTLLPINDTSGYLYYGLMGKLFKQNYIFKNSSFYLGNQEYQKTGTTFRPGGNPVVFNQKSYILVQDNSKGYGTALFAFELNKYGNINVEKEGEKVLGPSQEHAQFRAGMHHMSVLQMKNGKKIVAIDGNKLITGDKYFEILFFLKYSYLKLWDFCFGNHFVPYYPFNE
jgi:hypothetical protein